MDDKRALGTERQDGGTQGGQGEDAAERQPSEQEEPPAQEQQNEQPRGSEHSVAAATPSEAERGEQSEWRPSDSQQPQPRPQSRPSKPRPKRELNANPYKSLGDCLRKWQERLRILDDPNSDDQQQPDHRAPDALDDDAEEELTGTVENVAKQDRADAQLLGPVEEKEEERLEFPKEEEQPKEEKPEATMDQPDAGTEEDEDAHDEQENAKKEKDEHGKSRRGGRERLAPTRLSESTPQTEAERGEEEKEDEEFRAHQAGR